MSEATTTLTRRDILAGVPAALALGVNPEGSAHGWEAQPGLKARPKVAALVTEYRKWSHGQHIVDRFLDGYGWEGHHHHPQVDVVALYVDQRPQGDLSRERAERHPELKIYPTIAEALTLGGPRLAVDGVLLVAEHGQYPTNEKGQTLYPRYEFFRQVVEVYRKSGRTAPVFNDKHLSWKWEWAREMVDTARELGFPLLAGSSLPVTWRIPSVEMPDGAEVEEVVCVTVGGADSYAIHALEAVQCMVERRRGGETGAVAIQALRGDRVWEAARQGSWRAGGWDPELFEACLCRSFTLASGLPTYGNAPPEPAQRPALLKDPALAFRYEYADGLKATILFLQGLVGDITCAARLKGQSEPLSTQFYLPTPGSGAGPTLASFFSPLAHHIETMFLTGRAPYPVERTLLTTGLSAAGLDSIAEGGKRLATPHLAAVRYQPPRASTFWRA